MSSLFTFDGGVAIIADLKTGSGLTRIPTSVGPQIALMQFGASGATTSPSGIATTASYTGADLGGKPVRGMATFSITPGTDNGDVALISQASGLSAVTDIVNGGGSMHMVFTDTKVDVGYFNAGVLTVVQVINYRRTLAKDGTKYRCGFELSSTGVTVHLPDGTTSIVTSAEFFNRAGRYCQFESFTDTSGTSTATFHAVTFERLT